jgi:hypothetical protein
MSQLSAEQLQDQADNHRNNGEGLKAVEYYQRAIQLYQEAGNRRAAAECQHMIGVSHKVEDDIDAAIDNLKKAATLHREAGNEAGVGRVYRDIGIAYAYRQQHDEAITWLKKSVEALKGTDEYAELGISESKVGLHYLQVGDYQQAEQWIVQGLASIRRTSNWFYEMTTLLHAAALKLVTHRYSDAITDLWASLGLIYESDSREAQKRRLAQIYGLLAQAYLGLDSPAVAASFFTQAMQLLEPMADNVAAVVYEDIQAGEFIRRLEEADSEAYAKLKKEVSLSRIT